MILGLHLRGMMMRLWIEENAKRHCSFGFVAQLQRLSLYIATIDMFSTRDTQIVSDFL